ncbi:MULTISPECIES: DUF58 domain-containing protein [Bacillus]|uniref:DUF58 domain-containing protein n=1 Tax=Bacillus TaxID=1386 RepID=UPI000BB98E92|nr:MULTISPECIES: DUF58 domain-containing protein [Bacillus]
MIKLWKNLSGRFLFRDKGIVPTKKLVVLYGILSSILFLLTFFGIGWLEIFILNVLFISLTLIDLLLSPKKEKLKFKREMTSELERGIKYDVHISIQNFSNHTIKFEMFDDLPQSFQRPFPLKGIAEREKSTSLIYETLATIRGNYSLSKLYVRYFSKLGLWKKQTAVQLEGNIKVIPDLTESKSYLENAQKYLLHEGAKIRKQVSNGGEFSKIRTYAIGDDPRKINWRQTAKLREVMTNEYEPEHGKNITILIDCGRMMGAELNTGNRLEKSLEAAVTVATAALRNGDYVSVLAFSKEVKVYVPPAKGMPHLQTILKSIYHLEVDAYESNYGAVLNYLQTVQKKRSLLLLFSDVRTFLFEESTMYYLVRLRKRHLFFMVGVEDEMLAAKSKEEPDTLQKAMEKSMAQKQLLRKKREKLRWEKQGLPMIETKEENLATVAVSHYIDMLNRGLL